MAHPIHPAIVHFPIACLTLGTAADVSSIWMNERVWQAAGWLLIIGIASVVPAMLSGLFELRKVKGKNGADRVAELHIQCVLLTFTLYGASLFLRLEKLQLTAPGPIELALSGLGWIALIATGWFGARLVYEHRIGVSEK